MAASEYTLAWFLKQPFYNGLFKSDLEYQTPIKHKMYQRLSDWEVD